ncbi:hypothetical protein EVAR_59107_1 [Eumeta japonica]|uniref:Uncharacterized protein n=1 Tax=Eumeta variegata TaxID=151549 RepID=A0A4C1YZQ0_EUMVA|nr:hypothetical protein EVAR_59107_1 [Eumeta japonica]
MYLRIVRQPTNTTSKCLLKNAFQVKGCRGGAELVTAADRTAERLTTRHVSGSRRLNSERRRGGSRQFLRVLERNRAILSCTLAFETERARGMKFAIQICQVALENTKPFREPT